MKVLLVDDEPQIIRALRVPLEARGYEVHAAGNGETALSLLASGAFDVVVLDIGLPGIDGVEVARRVRGSSDVPIIVLSVRDGDADKVAALDAGADDYVTKPFSMDELFARLRAVLRRRPDAGSQDPVVHAGAVTVDLYKHSVSKDGAPVHLTPTEFDLLEMFVRNPGKLLTQRTLLTKVWGGGGGSQSLRVHIASLRRKLEDEASNPRLILTEPGLGYRLAETPTPDGTGPR